MKLALLSAGALLLLAADPVEIAFAPQAGTQLERSWSEALELEIDSLDEMLGGEPVNMPFDVIALEIEREFVVQDELTESGGGRPLDLTRTFDSSSCAFAVSLDGSAVGHSWGAAACDEGVVRFVFDAEEERYEAERVEGEVADLLEGLAPDMDLLGLLPAGEVEVGAKWKPAPEAMRAFFGAGGDMGFRPTNATIEMQGAPAELLIAGALGSLQEIFARADEIDGEVGGRFAGMEEGDEGEELARLEFELKLEAEADLGARYRSLFHGDVDDTTHDFQLGAEVEGTLVVLWDLAAGHLRSASFEGEVGLNGHLVFPATVMGEVSSFVGDYEMYGDGKVELTID